MSNPCSWTLPSSVSGAVSAAFPLGYTFAFCFFTFAWVLYNYMFVGTTASRLFNNTFDGYWASTGKFLGVDVFLFGGLAGWGCLFIAFVAWGFFYYYECFDGTPAYTTYPQEYLRLVVFGICYGIMCGDRAVLLYSDIAHTRNDASYKDGIIAPNPARVPTKAGFTARWNWAWIWMALTRPVALAGLCVFLGTYAQLQYATASYCTGVCWSGPKYLLGIVTPFCLASGIVLAWVLLVQAKRSYSYPMVYPGSVTHHEILAASAGRGLSASYVRGWIADYPLDPWWIGAFILFYTLSTTIITHDLNKGAMAFAYGGLVPGILTLLSQESSYFFPFFIASAATWTMATTFAVGVIHAVQGTTYPSNDATQVINWGAYLTGPDTAAHVESDGTWVVMLSIFTLVFSVLAGLSACAVPTARVYDENITAKLTESLLKVAEPVT